MDRPRFGEEVRRTEFCMRKGSVFLNHGSYGMVPRRIKERQKRYIRESDEHPDDWFLRKNLPLWKVARDAAATLINSDQDDVVLVQNATAGVNTVLKSLDLGETDGILVTDHTYRAVQNTARHVSESGGHVYKMDIKFPIPSEETIVQQYRDYLSTHADVRIAVIDHITSTTALLQPVKKIVKVCRDHNVLSVIDGAHGPGQVALDIRDLDPDFYAGNFHKWLYTPRGCALLYIKKEHQKWACPLVTSTNHGKGTTLEFFMQGTRDDSPYLCIPEALQFYNDMGGMKVITSYSSYLLSQACCEMVREWGTNKLPIPDSMEAPCMRMVRLPRLSEYGTSQSEAVRLMSDLYTHWDIQTAIMYVDGHLYVRLSANIYNTPADFPILTAVIKRMRETTEKPMPGSSPVTTFGRPIRNAEFGMKTNSTFLNNAAKGMVPNRVRDVHLRYIDEFDDHPDDWLRRKVFDLWTSSRDAAAGFLNADPEGLVFVQNATTGFNAVLKTFPFQPHDALLVTDHSFGAVQNTCRSLSSTRKDLQTYTMAVSFPITSEDQIVEQYSRFLTDHPDVKMAIIDHITSPTALKFPVDRLTKLCKDKNVLVLIDGAHAPGQLPLDIRALDPDFYVGNFHKWTFAPRGCAFLYVKKEHQCVIHPIVTSHLYKESLVNAFFMQGTQDHTPFVCLKNALQFYHDIGGMEKITAYNSKLLEDAAHLMTTRWGTRTLPVPKSMEAPFMRMVQLPPLRDYNNTVEDAERLTTDIFTQYDIQTQMICVRGPLYIRLSVQVYNELEDYRKLVNVIDSLREN